MSSQSSLNILAGAQNTNATHAQFISGHHVTVNRIEDHEKILATLMPVERGGHMHGCMKGTRKDVLSTVDDWVNDFTIDTPNILLLSGSPGAGKSTIAASVVSDLDRRKRLGSSFAFKHSEASLSDPTAVWRTVASDLARFHPGVKDNLVEILGRVEPGRADIDLQFQRLIEEPLTRNVEGLSHNPPVVVLDALDECGSDRSLSGQRRQLLDTLRKWGNLPCAFKLIVTSRDERLPSSFRDVCRHVVLETGSRVTSMASDDIQLLLRTRFGDI
jgi:Cdc6-like AAA superfamily ATPase